MTGMNVSDTQTGLRVIPMSWLPKTLNRGRVNGMNLR